MVPRETRLAEKLSGKNILTRYVYVSETNDTGVVFNNQLESFSERHRIKLDKPALRPCSDILGEIGKNGAAGIILEMRCGWPNRYALMLAWKASKAGFSVYFYWPREESVEVMDRHRFLDMVFMSLLVKAYRTFFPFQSRLPLEIQNFNARHQEQLKTVLKNIAPVPLKNIRPSGQAPRINGLGVYLRMDYWAEIRSGGSYGHTCYVAKELAHITQDFRCFMANRFELIDDFGVHQVVMASPAAFVDEKMMLDSSITYFDRLDLAFEVSPPAYIYERLVLGNYTGVRLSQKFKIPYLVEYNGSEIVMRRIFGDGQTFQYKNLFHEAERAAFQQATAINVISEAVRETLVEAGIDSQKIFVNPNCADPDAYAPGTEKETVRLRGEVGWTSDHVIIGFVGTFGGWHGIETLAKSLPLIIAEVPEARFLFIGQGSHQNLIIETLDRYGLNDKACMTGMLPQMDAASLMKMCDIFLSPHQKSMGKMKFFGSPTKVFEYMAMGGAIVASDLEQIGEVLSPALRPADLLDPNLEVSDQRAVLCQPGNVEEFVVAVTALAKLPKVRSSLGINARKAVLDTYSWSRHVERLLDFVKDLEEEKVQGTINFQDHGTVNEEKDIDPLKNEIMEQWDNNPCGSQHSSLEGKSDIEWFDEVSRFRHVEYGPWMSETMEFSRHADEDVLEIGGGLGTDLARFAMAGANVTDIDMSIEHLKLARENFNLRNLNGRFIRGDAESIPFAENTFDLVYSNGVIHHTPNTTQVIDEIYRVLKPGG
ncbi:MAG: methyltransferase domain-containing protein, partial [Alphaproteobacteria bacterium]|nr:methyltransferase domain-containing protein [Alphaproteobacteria bacterium]